MHAYSRLVTYHDDYGECVVTQGPLCGNDGENYQNICTFWKAQESKPDLKIRHYGGCGADDLIFVDTTFGWNFEKSHFMKVILTKRRTKKPVKNNVKVEMKIGIDYWRQNKDEWRYLNGVEYLDKAVNILLRFFFVLSKLVSYSFTLWNFEWHR